MSPRTRGYPLLRWFGFGILAVTCGPFIADAITGGTIWHLVDGIVILTPFILLNYLVWGCWTTRNSWTRDEINHTL